MSVALRNGINAWIVLLTVLLVVSFSSTGTTQAPLGPPTKFTSQPQSGNPQVLGSSKFLVCGANGKPSPTYRWKKDGRFLPSEFNGSSLKIKTMQKSSVGLYQCVATNIYGAILSSTASVQVAYMTPFVASRNNEKSVIQGRAIVIDVPPIDCYPSPVVQWYEGGSNTPIQRDSLYRHITLKNQLVLLETKAADSRKTFKAVATNGYTQQTSDSHIFRLTVHRGDSSSNDENELEIVIRPTDVVVSQGVDGSALFECVANARPLSYSTIRWSFRSRSSPGMTTIHSDANKYLYSAYGRILTVINPAVADAGVYICEASFKKSNIRIQNVSANATLTVRVKPTFNNYNSDSVEEELKVDVSDPVTVSCQTSGLPKPTISWYFNAVPVNVTSPRYRITESGLIVIQTTVKQDSGIYQCFAANDAGHISLTTHLNVTSSLPVISIVPSGNYSVVSGDSARIICSARGAPSPTVTWYKGIHSGEREPVGRDNNTVNILNFPSVTVGHSSWYSCSASNIEGTVHEDIYLHVAVRTMIINRLPETISVIKGQNLLMPCEVDYDRMFIVTWRWSHEKQGHLKEHWRVMEDGGLNIIQTDTEDAGYYTCDIASSGGNDSMTTFVKIIDLPGQPRILNAQLSSSSETSVDLSWSPGFDGNSPIKKFIIYARWTLFSTKLNINSSRDGDWQVVGEAEGSDVSTYTVYELQPAAMYQFSVSAINEVGEGERSQPSSTTPVPEQRPSGPPRGVVGSSNSNSSIILQWQSPDPTKWNGILLGYLIRYTLHRPPGMIFNYRNVSKAAQQRVEIQNLVIFEEYSVAIAAYNSRGVGVYSDPIKVKTQEGRPVAPPNNVTAAAVNSTTVQVTWNPPNAGHINGIIHGYKIQTDEAGIDRNERNLISDVIILNHALNTDDGGQMTYLRNLEKFTNYEISVLCFTSKGDGPKSRPVFVQTSDDVPDQVASLDVGTILDSSIDVHWTRPLKSNGILTGYSINFWPENRRESMVTEDLPVDAVNFTINGLTPDTTYVIDVAAKTRLGKGLSRNISVQSAIPPEMPEPPRAILFLEIDSTSVKLQINRKANGTHVSPLRWIVEGQNRSPDGHLGQRGTSDWHLIDVISSFYEMTVATINDLQPYRDYRVRISGENSVGRSASSQPSDWFTTKETLPSVAAMQCFTTSVVNSSAVEISWMPLSTYLWNSGLASNRHYQLRHSSCEGQDRGRETIERTDEIRFTVAGLRAFTAYCLQLSACNSIGCKNYSDVVSMKTRESVPSVGPIHLTAEVLSSTSVRLSWKPVPFEHQNGYILGYKILLKAPTTEGSWNSLTHHFAPASKTSFELLGLNKSTSYRVAMLAFTRIGDGQPSEVDVRTMDDVPGPPSSVYFPHVNETSARLAWLQPSQPNGIIVGYRVMWGKWLENFSMKNMIVGSDETLGPDKRHFEVHNLERSRRYVFTVSARTRDGWGEQTVLDVFTTSSVKKIPDRPPSPVVWPSHIGKNWATITWTAPAILDTSAPTRNYSLHVTQHVPNYREGATFVSHPDDYVLVLPSKPTEYNITRLQPHSVYWFRLAASNDVGMSEYSQPSQVVNTPMAAPDLVPVDIVVDSITSVSAVVKWKLSPDVDYKSWNGEMTGYQVFYIRMYDDDQGPFDDDSHHVVSVTYPSTQIFIKDFVPDAMYEVKVAAVNRMGHGPFSISTVFYTLPDTDDPISLTPESLRADVISSTAIYVTWKHVLADVDSNGCYGYKLVYWPFGRSRRSLDKFPGPVRAKYLAADENHTTLTGLEPHTKYSIVASVFDSRGQQGPNSLHPVAVTTLEDLPGIPERLLAISTSPTSATLTWLPPTHPNGVIEAYQLTYQQETTTDGETSLVQTTLPANKRSHDVRELVYNANYTFSIRAKTRLGFGPSTTVSLLIGQPQPGSPDAPENLRCITSEKNTIVCQWKIDDTISPSFSYIIQYRQLEARESHWTTVTVTDSSVDLVSNRSIGTSEKVVLKDDFQIKPFVQYEYRVFAVNGHGVSLPSESFEYTLKTDESPLIGETGVEFYQRWWFVLMVALIGVFVVILVVIILCWTGRGHRRASINGQGKRGVAGGSCQVQNSLYSPAAAANDPTIDDETGFATFERGHLQSGNGKKHKPLYTRAPPRPSPGSIMYDNDADLQQKLAFPDDDSGNASDKGSQVYDSDECENAQQMAAFLPDSNRRPHSLYDDRSKHHHHHPEEEPNGGHVCMVTPNGGHCMTIGRRIKNPQLTSFI